MVLFCFVLFFLTWRGLPSLHLIMFVSFREEHRFLWVLCFTGKNICRVPAVCKELLWREQLPLCLLWLLSAGVLSPDCASVAILGLLKKKKKVPRTRHRPSELEPAGIRPGHECFRSFVHSSHIQPEVEIRSVTIIFYCAMSLHRVFPFFKELCF